MQLHVYNSHLNNWVAAPFVISKITDGASECGIDLAARPSRRLPLGSIASREASRFICGDTKPALSPKIGSVTCTTCTQTS